MNNYNLKFIWKEDGEKGPVILFIDYISNYNFSFMLKTKQIVVIGVVESDFVQNWFVSRKLSKWIQWIIAKKTFLQIFSKTSW